MRKWQQRLLVDVTKINFMEDTDKIKSTFSNLCEPISEFNGISFNKTYGLLEVGDNYYRLDIGPNGINIQKINENSHVIKSVSYIINDDNSYEYKNIFSSKIYEFGELESVDFDYECILDNLMNLIVVEPF